MDNLIVNIDWDTNNTEGVLYLISVLHCDLEDFINLLNEYKNTGKIDYEFIDINDLCDSDVVYDNSEFLNDLFLKQTGFSFSITNKKFHIENGILKQNDI